MKFWRIIRKIVSIRELEYILLRLRPDEGSTGLQKESMKRSEITNNRMDIIRYLLIQVGSLPFGVLRVHGRYGYLEAQFYLL